MRKIIFKKIKDKIYPVNIFYSNNKNEIEKYVRKNSDDKNYNMINCNGIRISFFDIKGDYTIIIGVFNKKKDVLVHELLHFCTDLCNYIYHDLNNTNDKPLAYLIQYVYKEVCSINKQLK